MDRHHLLCWPDILDPAPDEALQAKFTGIGASGQLAALGLGVGAMLASRHPVLAGLAAAFLLLDDLRGYIEGDNSVIGWALEWLDSKLEELGTSFEDLGERARDVLQPVIDIWNAITDAIEGAIAAAQRFLGGDSEAGAPSQPERTEPRWTPKDFANSLIGQALGLADPDEDRIAGGKRDRVPEASGRGDRLGVPSAPDPSRFAPKWSRSSRRRST